MCWHHVDDDDDDAGVDDDDDGSGDRHVAADDDDDDDDDDDGGGVDAARNFFNSVSIARRYRPYRSPTMNPDCVAATKHTSSADKNCNYNNA